MAKLDLTVCGVICDDVWRVVLHCEQGAVFDRNAIVIADSEV